MAIHDRHIDLTGFLEGDSINQWHWQSFQLNSSLSPDDWRSIEYFQLRAREFLLNIEDLKLPRFWSLSIDHGGPRTTVHSNMFPGRHRVKSLYLDFRHFIADNEPSKFQRVVNILSKNVNKTHPIQTFLSGIKKNFLRDMNFGISINGKELSLSHLVNLWFNTEFFHAGRKEQEQERQEWLMVLHDEAAQHLLVWGIVNSAQTVKALYACVKDLSRNGEISVNCPDPKLIFMK